MRDPIGNIISYGRDAKNGEISLRHADGTTETWATDESSRQSRFTNRAGQVQTTTHNTEGRPATKSWSPAGAAPTVTYAYDVAGRTIAADNGNAKLTYTYDKAGRLQSETTDLSALVPGLAPQTVTYQYDMHGHRVTTGYPDRLSVLHEHDLQGRMVGVRLLGQPRLATYAYDSIGRRATVTRDNSITSTYVYDAVNQVRQITHANAGGTVASAQYRYDPLDRRTSRITEDGRSEEYAYDFIGQLTEVVRRAGGGAPVDRRIDYRYDGAGNRREVSAYKPRLGHLWDGVTPDVPQYMPNKFKAYLTELGSALGSASFSTVYNAITWLADSPYPSNGSDGGNRAAAAMRYITRTPISGEPSLDSSIPAYPMGTHGYNPDSSHFRNTRGTVSESDAKTFLQQVSADCWCP